MPTASDTFLRLFRYFFETFFQKICAKVLVSEDHADDSWTFSGLFLDFFWTFFQKICGKVLISEDNANDSRTIRVQFADFFRTICGRFADFFSENLW